MDTSNKDTQNLADIIQSDECNMSLDEIEAIVKDVHYLKRFEVKYGDSLYKSILMTLTHESYSEEKAKSLWCNIVAHKVEIDRLLNRDVGITVATLDYLSNIRNSLSDPVIIEEEKSNYIAKAGTQDELTGLYMRDVFDVVLVKEFDEFRRNISPLCLLMLDIDDFKKVNDLYGHPVGDHVLTSIGQCVNDHVREMDLAARYGGEELVIIMPNTIMSEALRVGERIRKKVELLRFDGFSVTISIGIAQASHGIDKVGQLMSLADKSLYQAKRSGKNRIISSDEE